jgi:hypothetical protein
MLTRPHHTHCVECGKPFGDPTFTYEAGRIENGAAYWSDRGLLCSHACAIEHFQRRRAAGDPMRDPAPNPQERTVVGRS